MGLVRGALGVRLYGYGLGLPVVLIACNFFNRNNVF